MVGIQGLRAQQHRVIAEGETAVVRDIRLGVGFFRHIKTIRLRKELGAHGVLALQELWCWAAEHRPDGDLSGMTDEEIAGVASWGGDPNQFVHSLSQNGWLDGGKQIHDWDDHQPYIVDSKERSKSARNAARAKWKKKAAQQGVAADADGMRPAEIVPCDPHPTSQDVCDADRSEGGDAPSGTFRSVSVRTLPTSAGDVGRTPPRVGKDVARYAYPELFEAWWRTYPRKEGDKRRVHTLWQAIRDRGSTADELQLAAENYAAQCQREGKPARYQKLASTFLGPSDYWRDHLTTPADPDDGLWKDANVAK